MLRKKGANLYADFRKNCVERKGNITKQKQIVSKQRVEKFGEVYTNEREVKAMCDLIPLEIWENIDSTFLEPACGNGNFIIEILQRKLKLCKSADEVYRAYKSIYGIDILEDNCKETKRRMLELCPYFADKEKVKLNIICGDSLKIMKDWSYTE